MDKAKNGWTLCAISTESRLVYTAGVLFTKHLGLCEGVRSQQKSCDDTADNTKSMWPGVPLNNRVKERKNVLENLCFWIKTL